MIISKMTIMIIILSMMMIMFFFKKSPAKLIFSIIIMTSFLSLEISDTTKNEWIGFSLFFLIVSGLMILFSMITSIIPKTTFNSHKNTILPIMMMFPIIFISINNSMIAVNPNMVILFKMQLFWLIIIILNLMLLIISKLISSPEKPFRSKM